MAEIEGFEPPQDVNPLLVFKTSPFSQTWVNLRILMVDPVGLEPTTDRLTADSSTTELLRNNYGGPKWTRTIDLTLIRRAL